MSISTDLKKLHEKHDAVKVYEPGVVTSGNLMLDWATGQGGIPRACIADIFGEEGLGKTTMALSIIGERTKYKEHCAFIDVEHKLHQNLIDMVVPNKEYLEWFQPDNGDAALATLEGLIKMKDIRMIALDSMSAIVPTEMLEEDANPNRMGLAAARITFALKRILTPVYSMGTIVFLLHQMRANLNLMSRITKVPTTNWATRHLTSYRMQIAGGDPIRDGENIIGRKLKMVFVKNSWGFPGKIAPISILYGKGIDRVRDLIDCGVVTGVIGKKGPGWYQYEDDDKTIIKAHGEEELIQKMMPIMPKVYERIRLAMTELKSVAGEETQDEESKKENNETDK